MTDSAEGRDLFQSFIRALRAADPDISAWEIADSLFLGDQLRRERGGLGVEDREPQPAPATAAAGGAPQPGTVELPFTDASTFGGESPHENAGAPPAPPAGAAAAALYADVASTTGVRARRVRAPAGRALTDSLGIMRALRPLMRRVPSRTALVLDVDATVQHVAEAQLARVRVWSPVHRPLAERWLSIDLVVDSHHSMAPWRETIDEFHGLLERSGGFRAVRRWRWDTQETLSLGRDASAASRATLPSAPDARLVLVISDCLSDRWRDGSALRRLAGWATDNPVALVQVLPEHLWERTALAAAPSVMAHQTLPSTSNRQLQYAPLGQPNADLFDLLNLVERDFSTGANTSAPGEEGDAGVAIPVVTLEPTRLRPWARMVAGRAGPSVRAVLVASPSSSAEPAAARAATGFVGVPEQGADREIEVRRLVESFRGYASPAARRLAVSLTAVAPITLSIMRVVRDALIPGASESHVAEVLMSGFLVQRPDSSATDLAYEWAPGVQEQLSVGLTASDFAAVGGAVTRWINARAGSPREMTALTPDPAGAERLVITERTRPFAYLYANNLRRLDRPADAERLHARAAMHERIPAPPGLDLQRSLAGHDGVVFRLAWSPDGRWLLTPSVDGTIRIWAAETGHLAQVLRVSHEGVNEIAWLRHGTRFAAACHDGYLRLWDLAANAQMTLVREVGPHHTDIRSAAASPEGTAIAIACESGLVRIYTVDGDLERELHHPAVAAPMLAWSADGVVWVGDVSGNIRFFHPADAVGEVVSLGGGGIFSLASSLNVIASGDYNGDVVVRTGGGPRDAQRLARSGSRRAHDDTVSALAFSPDGSILASKGMDDCVRFWRSDTWSLIGELAEPAGNFVLAGLAWHPRLPLLATLGDRDRLVRVWHTDLERMLPVPVVRRRPTPVRQRGQPGLLPRSTVAQHPYWEVAFDDHGVIVGADTAARLAASLGTTGVTDLFVFVHGWNNDRAEANSLYRSFLTTMVTMGGIGGATAHRRWGAVGVIWPSKLWPDEGLADEDVWKEADESAERGELEAAEEAKSSPDEPGPVGRFLGRFIGSAKRAGQLTTYWQMRDRARIVGDVGLGLFFTGVRAAAPDVRLHVVGHSVGARAVMYALRSMHTRGSTLPVSSVVLLQPVLSHLAFAPAADAPRPLARTAWQVEGPLIVTHSHSDNVATVYRTATGVTGDDDVPGERAAALKMMGRDGAEGVSAHATRVGPVGAAYTFPPGRVVNVDISPIFESHTNVVTPATAWLLLSAADFAPPPT